MLFEARHRPPRRFSAHVCHEMLALRGQLSKVKATEALTDSFYSTRLYEFLLIFVWQILFLRFVSVALSFTLRIPSILLCSAEI